MDGQGRSRDDEGGIAETRDAFVAALGRGDARAASAVYADEARLLPPAAELVTGRIAIEAFWQAGIDSGITAVELESLELVRHGGLAHEIGGYALRLEPSDRETVVDRGKYLLVHARQADGSWRRLVEMFSPDAPPARTGPQPPGRRHVAGNGEAAP
jgi:ketosteroid isomerase-like protein